MDLIDFVKPENNASSNKGFKPLLMHSKFDRKVGSREEIISEYDPEWVSRYKFDLAPKTVKDSAMLLFHHTDLGPPFTNDRARYPRAFGKITLSESTKELEVNCELEESLVFTNSAWELAHTITKFSSGPKPGQGGGLGVGLATPPRKN